MPALQALTRLRIFRSTTWFEWSELPPAIGSARWDQKRNIWPRLFLGRPRRAHKAILRPLDSDDGAVLDDNLHCPKRQASQRVGNRLARFALRPGSVWCSVFPADTWHFRIPHPKRKQSLSTWLYYRRFHAFCPGIFSICLVLCCKLLKQNTLRINKLYKLSYNVDFYLLKCVVCSPALKAARSI